MDLPPSCSHHAHNTINVTSLIGEESKPPSTDAKDDARSSDVLVSSIEVMAPLYWQCRWKAVIVHLPNPLVEHKTYARFDALVTE
jgi:hypothetical protein